MDEIICPECGRPNLVEAEKCWYCQVPLVSKEDVSEELSETDADRQGKIREQQISRLEENEENLPEWLKRIRELKKRTHPSKKWTSGSRKNYFPGWPRSLTACKPIRSTQPAAERV